MLPYVAQGSGAELYIISVAMLVCSTGSGDPLIILTKDMGKSSW
jgi:hypothetical protein